MPKTDQPKKSKFDFSSIAVLFLVAFLLGIAAGYFLWGMGGAANGTGNLIGADSPVLGPKNAPVTIVEFSDYQCPYCKMWHEQVYHQLLAEYGNKIRFVYRDFPLTSIHPNAEPAAEAARCAGDQDKYWEYHDALFSGQYNLSRDGYLQIASALGLNTTTFTSCIDGHKHQAEVQADLQAGMSMGVQSTPTFYINGSQVIGAQPYANFKSIIDQILAGK